MATARAPRLTGVFGGTFDPVHFGHLRSALEMGESLGLDQVLMLPAALPPHRQLPAADAQARLEMVQLATAKAPLLRVDDRELKRSGPSYMVDTLQQLKDECGVGTHLVLLLGCDAFAGLSHWHRWEQILQLAHIGVATRPGWQQQGSGPAWMDAASAAWTHDPGALRSRQSGMVIRSEVTALEISATQIRALCREGRSGRYLLPDTVWDYIENNRLYR